MNTHKAMVSPPRQIPAPHSARI